MPFTMAYQDELKFYREKVASLITSDVVSAVRVKHPGVTGQVFAYLLCLDVAMDGFQALQGEVENLHSIIAKQTSELAAMRAQCDDDAASMSREGDSDLEAALDLKYQNDDDP
jgi:hypothetical protein